MKISEQEFIALCHKAEKANFEGQKRRFIGDVQSRMNQITENLEIAIRQGDNDFALKVVEQLKRYIERLK